MDGSYPTIHLSTSLSCCRNSSSWARCWYQLVTCSASSRSYRHDSASSTWRAVWSTHLAAGERCLTMFGMESIKRHVCFVHLCWHQDVVCLDPGAPAGARRGTRQPPAQRRGRHAPATPPLLGGVHCQPQHGQLATLVTLQSVILLVDTTGTMNMQPIRPEVRRLRTQMRSRERVETVTSILLSGTTPPPPGVLSWSSDSVILSVNVATGLEANQL